jgi:hypothetical protein
MNIPISWVMIARRLVRRYQSDVSGECTVSYYGYAEHVSSMLIQDTGTYCQFTWHHIPEDRNLLQYNWCIHMHQM